MAMTVTEDLVAQVRNRIAELSTAEVDQLDAALRIDFSERVMYQNLQAAAHASGVISPAVASWLYRTIGESGSDANGGWARGVSTADKYVAVKILTELAEIRARRSF